MWIEDEENNLITKTNSVFDLMLGCIEHPHLTFLPINFELYIFPLGPSMVEYDIS